jgi:hypothetical protein
MFEQAARFLEPGVGLNSPGLEHPQDEPAMTAAGEDLIGVEQG